MDIFRRFFSAWAFSLILACAADPSPQQSMYILPTKLAKVPSMRLDEKVRLRLAGTCGPLQRPVPKHSQCLGDHPHASARPELGRGTEI